MNDEKKTKAQLIAELEELRGRLSVGNGAVDREISARKQAEDQLHVSEERFRRIFTNNMVPMGIWIKSGEILEANDALLAVIGYTRADLAAGQVRWNEITPAEYMQRDAQAVREVEESGLCAPYEKVFRHKNGQPIPILIGGATFDEHERMGIFYAIDLTRRKQAEEKIIHTERRYRALIENAPDGVVLIDVNGTFKYVSPSIERLFGYTEEDLPHCNAAELTHPDDLDMVLAELMKLMKDPTYIPTREYRFRHQNGDWRWIESTFTNLLAETNVEGIVINFRDIHERKLAEETLRAEKEKLEKIAASVPGVICSFHQSPTGHASMPYASPAIHEVYGLAPADVADDMTPIFSRILPEDLEHVRATITRSAHTLEIWKDEFRYHHPTKGLIWIDGYSAPVCEADGGITWHGFIADVTERKLTEEKLRESEQKYRDLINGMNDVICVIDHDTSILDVNTTATSVLGYSREELLSKRIPDIDVNMTPARIQHLAGSMPADKTQVFETMHRTKEGRTFPVEVSSSLVSYGGRVVIMSISRDISERKQAEEQRRRLAERLNLATRAAQIGIWDWDIQKDELVWDEQMYLLYGLASAEFGGVYEAWLNGVHPDDRDATGDILARSLRSECEYDTEFRVVWPDGTVHWLQANGQVFCDERGTPVRMVGVNYEVTERKLADKEKARLEAHLQHSQKMETIGTLAGGIAHDFNNMLTPIMGYADMAIAHLSASDPLAEDLKMIFNAANRAKDLVEQILIFSRQIDKEQKPLRLHLVVKEAVKLLRPTIPSTIAIIQRIDASCPHVLADPTQMHQVVMNLCINAFHAMEGKGGTLTIELRQVNIDRATIRLHPLLAEAEYVRLSISDTGTGMDKAILERIFEPFYTTKSPGKGTGMGLSVVHGIVRAHNGDIMVASEPGKGTTFHVYLPITAAEPKSENAESAAMERGHEHILVVDDEIAIASMMNKMLEKLGYTADICYSSIEALKVFRQQPARHDLVISDLTMPGMTGLDLAEQLHKIKKELPIILISGYGRNLSNETLKEHGIKKIIGKPILVKELALAIREAIDT